MKRKNIIPIYLILIGFLSSCSHNVHKDPIKNAFKKKANSIPIELKPIPIKPKTLSELENMNETNYHNIKINLSFDNVQIKKALLMLAKATGFNIIIPPEIEGKVTLELKENTLEGALDALLRPFGYSFKIDGQNIYVINKVTKIFHVNLPEVNRNLTTSIQANMGGVTESESSTSDTNMSITNSYSLKFWENIKKSLEIILKEDKTSTYSIEPLTGTIIVSAKPETIKKVDNFIQLLNKETSKQVLIEAKIVEVKLDKKNQTGINWKYLINSKTLSSDGEHISMTFNSGTPQSLPFQLSITKVNNKFSAILGILSKFGKVNVLSSPRILAINGQPAMIKVGKDYIAIYRSQTTSTTATGTQTASTITSEEITTDTILTEGIVLSIVPRIDDKGNIILNITPAISSLDTPLISGPSGQAQEFLNKIYAVNVRQLNTVIRAKSGQTIILGGLIAKSKSKSGEGVPLLKDIPIIGNAFKTTTDISSRSELIIMLTPYIQEEKN